MVLSVVSCFTEWHLPIRVLKRTLVGSAARRCLAAQHRARSLNTLLLSVSSWRLGAVNKYHRGKGPLPVGSATFPAGSGVLADGDGLLPERGGVRVVGWRPRAGAWTPAHVDATRLRAPRLFPGAGRHRRQGPLEPAGNVATLPTGKGPFPAVELVHGSGPNDQDETLGPKQGIQGPGLGSEQPGRCRAALQQAYASIP